MRQLPEDTCEKSLLRKTPLDWDAVHSNGVDMRNGIYLPWSFRNLFTNIAYMYVGHDS